MNFTICLVSFTAPFLTTADGLRANAHPTRLRVPGNITPKKGPTWANTEHIPMR
ncbi:Uncharacterised protein [Mycobacteroides abscessus subsp. abscessus]|nr:Uncharacterised protein [Mycobacteroides abscessus subsp. abscessus]